MMKNLSSKAAVENQNCKVTFTNIYLIKACKETSRQKKKKKRSTGNNYDIPGGIFQYLFQMDGNWRKKKKQQMKSSSVNHKKHEK